VENFHTMNSNEALAFCFRILFIVSTHVTWRNIKNTKDV